MLVENATSSIAERSNTEENMVKGEEDIIKDCALYQDKKKRIKRDVLIAERKFDFLSKKEINWYHKKENEKMIKSKIENLYEWQKEFLNLLNNFESDERTINLIIGEEGNEGKNQIQKYAFNKFKNNVKIILIQGLSLNTSTIHAEYGDEISYEKTIFLINITRSGDVNFHVLESLSEGVIPAYDRYLKKNVNNPIVFVFANRNIFIEGKEGIKKFSKNKIDNFISKDRQNIYIIKDLQLIPFMSKGEYVDCEKYLGREGEDIL